LFDYLDIIMFTTKREEWLLKGWLPIFAYHLSWPLWTFNLS
jgi:hypothetical protein